MGDTFGHAPVTQLPRQESHKANEKTAGLRHPQGQRQSTSRQIHAPRSGQLRSRAHLRRMCLQSLQC